MEDSDRSGLSESSDFSGGSVESGSQVVERDLTMVNIQLSEKTREIIERFTTIYGQKKIDKEGLNATTELIWVSPSNYTAWSFRRQIINKLKIDLRDELDFVSNVLRENQKNYQGWYHRSKIVEKLNDYTKELQFTAEILELDNKNYHAWQYRHWLLNQTQGWTNEMSYVEFMLTNDVYNNSAWHQRYQTFLKTKGLNDDSINSEIVYTFQKLDTHIDNEAAWNYLFGLIPRGRFKDYISILEQVQKLVDTHTNACRFVHDFLVQFRIGLLEEKYGDVEELKSLIGKDCDILSNKLDTLRKGYWKYVKTTLDQRIPCGF
ncbi:Protein farnesyltransferase/geranylgeranyltransferase type-1 subunit alpha [Thelohanellus kitauei]|uniref:Protein farnesyltransferase/geranylgeranyltransferase type-1 subunit alpha n=1 Tax=Thelohanellus kitauei TaxID=669202 RepID=A0A0C2IZ43_THEKT|nr:Protein farnesyltransferase/geranylgeranyltransferase type-1 subunit alpha [Thelohanellus kitauei]